MKLSREKDIEKQCIEALRVRGIYCQKIHSGAMFAKAGSFTYKVKLADQGTPDIMACFRGRFLGIEIKSSPEEHAEWERQWQCYLDSGTDKNDRVALKSWERSVVQHFQHDNIRAAGGEVIVCSSFDELMADIDQLLREYQNQT